MSFSTEAKPATTGFTSTEALARGGTNIAAKFGTARFGSSRFGKGGDDYRWTYGAKPATTGFSTKEALPS